MKVLLSVDRVLTMKVRIERWRAESLCSVRVWPRPGTVPSSANTSEIVATTRGNLRRNHEPERASWSVVLALLAVVSTHLRVPIRGRVARPIFHQKLRAFAPPRRDLECPRLPVKRSDGSAGRSSSDSTFIRDRRRWDTEFGNL